MNGLCPSDWDNGTDLGNLTCHPSLSPYRYVGASLGLVVTALGGLGNLLTMLAFTADPRLRTAFNRLVLNLTLADLLYCSLLQPLTVHTYLRNGWAWGRDSCRLFGLMLFASNLVSILNMAAIAGARYLLVSGPRRFHRLCSGRLGPVFLAGPWLLALVLLAPFWCVFQFQPTVCTCSFHRTAGRPYTTILHAATFGLGLGSIGTFYLLIHRRLRATGQALRSHRELGAGTSLPPPSSSSTLSAAALEGSQNERSAISPEAVSGGSAVEGSGGGGEGERDSGLRRMTARWKRRRRRQGRRGSEVEFRRVTTMCFSVFLVYLACYLPFCLVHLAESRAPYVLQMLAGNLTWFNSCINPILYAAMNRQFKEAYRVVLSPFCAGS
ncbi:G-protein coupled receptor 84-like [Carcharodon carcharias]|uniref:G-protein coupled receptor 84-like n=1 Tax=Carcharodon carcharias TaxID=13397 RepID=UPI001B7F4DFF|nr:G-protein coupled receptor 84-like [Carcharodon carcharias]